MPTNFDNPTQDMEVVCTISDPFKLNTNTQKPIDGDQDEVSKDNMELPYFKSPFPGILSDTGDLAQSQIRECAAQSQIREYATVLDGSVPVYSSPPNRGLLHAPPSWSSPAIQTPARRAHGIDPENRVTLDEQYFLGKCEQLEEARVPPSVTLLNSPNLVEPAISGTGPAGPRSNQEAGFFSQEINPEPAISIPHNLPPGVTAEMYIQAHQLVVSKMVLSSDLQTATNLGQRPPEGSKQEVSKLGENGSRTKKNTVNASRNKRKQWASDPPTIETKGKGGGRKRPKDPIELARRMVELHAIQVEKGKRKMAMRDSENTI